MRVFIMRLILFLVLFKVYAIRGVMSNMLIVCVFSRSIMMLLNYLVYIVILTVNSH